MPAEFLTALRPLFDCLTDGVCIADADGRLLYANAAAGRLLGPRAEMADESTICEFLCKGFEKPCCKSANGGSGTCCPLKVPHGEVSSQTRKGKFLPTGRDLRVRCLRVRQPSVERHFIIIEDVSDQAEVGRHREEWRMMLAHDFRAPLTIMHGTLRAMQDLGAGHPLSADDCDLLDNAVRNSRRLDDLIELFLETTRLEDGAMPIQATGVNVDLLLREIVREEAPVAKAHGLKLTIGAASALTARADPELLRRATTNVIENAVKFTPSGGTITVDSAPDFGSVLIRISDNGTGISPRDLPRIFDRFSQGENARRGHGLGLGLAFCRAAMNAMGGDISAESEEGSGSVFTLRLPVMSGVEAKP